MSLYAPELSMYMACQLDDCHLTLQVDRIRANANLLEHSCLMI